MNDISMTLSDAVRNVKGDAIEDKIDVLTLVLVAAFIFLQRN